LLVVVFTSLTGICQEGDKRLDQIVSRGYIVIGINLEFPPVGFYNDKGEPDGYDVDLAKDLAKALGVDIKWEAVTNETRSAVLVSDKVDLVFSNYTRTPERAKVIDFTDPYVITGVAILARKEYKITGLADLVGKKVATTKGTTCDLLLREQCPEAERVLFDAIPDTLIALKQNKVVALLEDMVFVGPAAAADPNLEAVGGLLNSEVNCIALRRGQPDWKSWLNLWLDDLNRSGKNIKYYEKWFGFKPPKLTPNY
jgi:polar amino acid transport system substrate-binding protein